MMERTLKARLIENALLYVGIALMIAAVVFWCLIEMLLKVRKASITDDLLLTLQWVQDMGTVFIFAVGVAVGVAGFLYAAVRAWQAFQGGGNKEKHP
ncbi:MULTISPECIES: hypothetical protein [Enterobacterales]|nr:MULTISPECIES: hypothetical protein [Providencia]MCJ4607361.1 hypothetical protein [Klebsiella pneumoniae]ELR5099806.1 hypothetical protein [Providencia rettgeri]EMC8781231.1 hypothetical protein [Providencia rettgeri]MCL0013156.1 hypothetical protein [Providencia rettgeri]MDE4734857.1 hypothetical protein [Providencia rettgeri]